MFPLPKIPQPVQKNKQTNAIYKGLPCFNLNEFNKNKPTLIGSGGFGKVFLGTHKKELVVAKVLKGVTEDALLKEARFHYRLKHKNLVTFKAICPSGKALMLEYVFFDLQPFGVDRKVSGLDDLLDELNKFKFKGFEHLVPRIGKDIVSGLSYLHAFGIAHRDLKPGNVLVSNQHLLKLSPEELGLQWQNSPCIAKLTDFGESWGNLAKSSEAACTHTINVYKGTPAFMAPEIIDPKKRPFLMREDDMKMADIWSLGMLLFCLSNPSCKVPFAMEAKSELKQGSWSNFFKHKVALGVKPTGDPEYDILRATEWVNVNEAFHQCIEKDPVKRISVDTALEILDGDEFSESYPLKIHQGSALIKIQESHVRAGTDDAINFQRPKNDGTNACAFLSLKIAESILFDREKIASERQSEVEKIIDRFPSKLDGLRDIDERYTVEDAHDILHAGKLLSPCELTKLSRDHAVFSEEGKAELSGMIEVDGNVCIVTVPDFTFVVANLSPKILVIDTHVIPESLGGNGNGVIKVFDSSKSGCRWIWKRLHSSGVKDQRQCIHSLQLVNGRLDSQNSSSMGMRITSESDDVLVISNDERGEAMPSSDGCSDDVTNEKSPTTREPINEGKDIHAPSNIESQNLLYASSWEKQKIGYWGPMKIPFVSGIKRKLSNAEVYALTTSNVQRATRIPQACRRNSVFAIDSRTIGDPENAKSDLNGTFTKCIEAKKYTVVVSTNSDGKCSVKAVAKKVLNLEGDKIYLSINRRENKFGLIRSISYFCDSKGTVLNDKVILQYFVNRQICGDVDQVEYTVEAHGNSKSGGSFYPLKKTTLGKIEKRLLDEKIKASEIYKELSGQEAGPDFGDLPRSKRQIVKKACSLGVSNQSTPAFEVEAILAYDNELEGNGIIWSHNDIPNDMWVLGTKRMADSLRIAATAYPISIDPTFNHGAYEVTPVTYRHPFIEAKSKNVVGKWTDAVMIGPTILHHEKTEDAFDCGMRPIARKAGLIDAKFGFITDGEMALINACKANFLKAKDLRCTIHFKENCKKFLKSIGICGERKQAPLLDIVFGVDGLVESEDRKDLERRLKEAQQVIVEIQKELVGDGETTQSFFKYLEEHEKTVLRKLIQKRRIKVGMNMNESGIPERVYSNQSETTNSILSARKLALGYSKKDDMPKGQFITKVWQAVVTEQCKEIERALHGQSEQFRLKKEAKYLQVTTEDWYNWTKRKQEW